MPLWYLLQLCEYPTNQRVISGSREIKERIKPFELLAHFDDEKTLPLNVLPSQDGTKHAANALSTTNPVVMPMLPMTIPMVLTILVSGKSTLLTGLHGMQFLFFFHFFLCAHFIYLLLILFTFLHYFPFLIMVFFYSSGGSPPCDVNTNRECAIKVWQWGGNSYVNITFYFFLFIHLFILFLVLFQLFYIYFIFHFYFSILLYFFYLFIFFFSLHTHCLQNKLIIIIVSASGLPVVHVDAAKLEA